MQVWTNEMACIEIRLLTIRFVHSIIDAINSDEEDTAMGTWLKRERRGAGNALG